MNRQVQSLNEQSDSDKQPCVLIKIIGPKGSGKDTIANIIGSSLKDFGMSPVKFDFDETTQQSTNHSEFFPFPIESLQNRSIEIEMIEDKGVKA